MYLSRLVWIFYRSEIVSQNTVNSHIAAHNKNKLKFHGNCGYIGNASSEN